MQGDFDFAGAFGLALDEADAGEVGPVGMALLSQSMSDVDQWRRISRRP